jgi:hypothetical protein
MDGEEMDGEGMGKDKEDKEDKGMEDMADRVEDIVMNNMNYSQGHNKD